MPGSRRPFSRLQAPPPSLTIKPKLTTSGTAVDADGIGGLAGLLLPPTHSHVPEVPVDSNISFEGVAFLFAIVSMCLQYVNLYKTVWWLPHSHAMYALNFHLIDTCLMVFLVILMSRRVIWCFINELHVNRNRNPCIHWFLQLTKAALLTSLLLIFVSMTYHIILRHTLLYALFLCYPLITYVILFGLNLKPFFAKCLPTAVVVAPAASSPTVGDKSPAVCGSAPGSPTVPSTPPLAPSSPTASAPRLRANREIAREVIQHNCTSSPEAVREEVDYLKTDFNNRIKQVLFNSMVSAYYMGFIPLCFAQHVQNNCDNCWNTLYYDAWWVSQHVVLIWLGAFVLYAVHFLPLKYLDILHRCSLHLGRWTKVEGRHAHVPYNAWSELQVWQQGALVKHVRGLFRAEGINNSAEPGNGMHSRFYFLFQPPLRMTTSLLVLTLLLVVYQFVLLVQATEWIHILSLAFLLFANYCALFKLMRDFLVLKAAYKDEQTSFQS